MASLNDVQAAIRNADLKWEAGTTPIGQDFVAGRPRNFGFARGKGREPGGGRGRMPKQTFAFAGNEPPKTLDWRNIEGKNFVSPVLDQGVCASCVAFATCAVLESRVKVGRQDPHHEIELSKAHLFFCGTTNGCDEGWTPGAALQRCKTAGVGRERDFRYEPKTLNCKQIESVVKVSRWRRHDLADERREALWKRGPVIGGMVVYSDFVWYKSGVYRPTVMESVGLHCIAIIGFDNNNSSWLIKNSWGTAWGEGGFARIGYGACGIDAQFPFYDPIVELVTTEERGA